MEDENGDGGGAKVKEDRRKNIGSALHRFSLDASNPNLFFLAHDKRGRGGWGKKALGVDAGLF